ncbi:MAG: hypothetical protein Q9217_000232 [Psora testacea]
MDMKISDNLNDFYELLAAKAAGMVENRLVVRFMGAPFRTQPVVLDFLTCRHSSTRNVTAKNLSKHIEASWAVVSGGCGNRSKCSEGLRGNICQAPRFLGGFITKGYKLVPEVLTGSRAMPAVSMETLEYVHTNVYGEISRSGTLIAENA